jgi:ABC-2 type transport system permease protein
VQAFVAGPVATVWARTAYPTPRPAEFALAIASEKDRLPSWDERVEAVIERFLAGDIRAADAPVNAEVIALTEAETEETALYDRQFAALFQTFERQDGAVSAVALWSPTLAAETLSRAFAGTDYAHHRAFLRAAADYRARFVTMLNADLPRCGWRWWC